MIAAEALAQLLAVLNRVVAGDVAIPDVLAGLVAALRSGSLAPLRPVILQVWAEAVRDAYLAEMTRSIFGQLLARIVTLLDRHAAAGRLPPGTDTAAAARLILATLQSYAIQLTAFGDVPPEQVRAAAAALFGQR